MMALQPLVARMTDDEITADYWRHVFWRACEPDNVLLLFLWVIAVFIAWRSYKALAQ